MQMPAMDDRDGAIWLNGAFVPWRDAKVHVLSHGLHYAGAVFEGVRAYGGTIFALRRHTERLSGSARILGYELPFDADAIDAACLELLSRHKHVEAYLRPIAWRGSETLGIAAAGNRINVAVAAWEWPSYFDPTAKMKGLRLDFARWRRPDPATAPCHAKASGLYMICTISKQAAEADGYADALMLDWRGFVAEATGANVFFFGDGALHTPVPDCFLDGITRRTVIDLARRRGIEVHERPILPEELSGFTECFLTGTAAEITPVAEIGPYRFTPGGVCRQFIADYAAEVNSGRDGSE